MGRVTSIAKSIVAREDGYVNDPGDPCGATRSGLTIHIMPCVGLDLDRDDDVDARDVKLLTYDHAADDHYFRGNASHAVPECFATIIRDLPGYCSYLCNPTHARFSICTDLHGTAWSRGWDRMGRSWGDLGYWAKLRQNESLFA